MFDISTKSDAKIRIYTHYAKKYANFSDYSLLFVTFTAKKQSILNFYSHLHAPFAWHRQH